jgi:hypothetical protein
MRPYRGACCTANHLLWEVIMSTTTGYRDSWINPRLKIAALWTSMLFIFVCVDVFSMYRSDVRADIEAGKMAVFTIGRGYLLGVMVYVALPSLMVFLSLVLPVKVARMTNIVLAVLYAVTVAGSAVGEWSYFILGSLLEAGLLVAVVYYAWTWPKVSELVAAAPNLSHRGDQEKPVTTIRGSQDVPTSRR